MSKDPSKLISDASSEISKMAENPQQYAEEMIQKMEEQALKMMDDRLQKQFGEKKLGYTVSCILSDIYKKDLEQLKYDLTSFIK